MQAPIPCPSASHKLHVARRSTSPKGVNVGSHHAGAVEKNFVALSQSAESWQEQQSALQKLFHAAHSPGEADHRPKPYMRLREVLELIPVSASTVWRWVRVGKLTAIKLGPRITVFSRAEVMDVFFSEVAR